MLKSTSGMSIRFLAFFIFITSLEVSAFSWQSLKRAASPFKDFDAERQLLRILENDEFLGRGATASAETLQSIDDLVKQLERSQVDKGVVKPTLDSRLDGVWRLLFTSSPGTNSPIQKTFTALDVVSIFQIINLAGDKSSFLSNLPEVSNTVTFGNTGRLRVTALASTETNRLIVPRKGDGKILGLNIFGISSSSPPRNVYERVDFAFQEAAFEFASLPLSIPYPVPFKLLGDEAKGWIDVTYLSEDLRVSRGNKGTIFILKKVKDPDTDPKAQLAIARDLKTYKFKSAKTVPVPPPSSSSSSRTNGVKQQQAVSRAVPSSPAGAAASQWPSSRPQLASFFSPKQKASPSRSNASGRIAVMFPAQLCVTEDYSELAVELMQRTGNLLPAKTLRFYYDRIDDTVEKAREENPKAEIVLIAHSIGGWVARAWLGEECAAEVRSSVASLITLGSPHNPPPSDSAAAKIDQTRGLLSYIDGKFPGAHEGPHVKYVSVIGSAVKGSISIDPSTFSSSNGDKGTSLFGEKLEQAVAYASYFSLLGDGSAAGDGIVPVKTAALSGAKVVDIETCHHSDFVPSPLGPSVKVPLTWYGSPDVIDMWASTLA